MINDFDDGPMLVLFLSGCDENPNRPGQRVHLALPQTHNGDDQPIRWFLYFRLISCVYALARLFFFLLLHRLFSLFYFKYFYTFLWFILISTCWSVLIIVLTCVYVSITKLTRENYGSVKPNQQRFSMGFNMFSHYCGRFFWLHNRCDWMKGIDKNKKQKKVYWSIKREQNTTIYIEMKMI